MKLWTRNALSASCAEHEPELKAAGLLHLRLFGSVARGEDSPKSDLDLLFDYDETDTWNLLGAYGYQDRVSDILGTSVHLRSAKHMRPEIKMLALQETVRVL